MSAEHLLQMLRRLVAHGDVEVEAAEPEDMTEFAYGQRAAYKHCLDLAEKELPATAESRPTSWLRILKPDGTLWMETSSLEEVTLESKKTGWPVQRMWIVEEKEWRD